MKSFDVGQRVWKFDKDGTEQEGRVLSFSPTGASMRVKWEGASGRTAHYNEWGRYDVLSDAEADARRETRRLDREERMASSELDSAISTLRDALSVRYHPTNEKIGKIKRATAELTAMVERLKGEG